MAVLITWSSLAGGTAIASLDHGSSGNGTNTTAQEIFVRHDGDNTITNCAFYFAQKTGTYTGDVTAADDFSELLEWGDASTAGAWGGIQINMDATGGFSGGSTWDMSETQKTSVDGLKYTVRTGKGHNSANSVLLATTMSSSMTTAGELPADVTDASFQLRLKIPSTEDTAGVRQFSQVLVYTATS